MSRVITAFSVVVLVTSLFVGRVLNAQAAATPSSPADAAVQQAEDATVANLGCWAA